MSEIPILFLKAHIPGYTRKDGTVVLPHETKAPAAHKPAPAAKKPTTAQWPGWNSKKQTPLDLFGDEDLSPASSPSKAAAVAGAQFGGQTVSAAKKKWSNSLHSSSGQGSMFSGGYQKKTIRMPSRTRNRTTPASRYKSTSRRCLRWSTLGPTLTPRPCSCRAVTCRRR